MSCVTDVIDERTTTELVIMLLNAVYFLLMVTRKLNLQESTGTECFVM